MGRIVKDWKPIKVADALVAPHRYLWDGTIGPNGVRIEGDVGLAKSFDEAKACFAYDEGDVVYLDLGGKAVKARIWLRIYGKRDSMGFRQEAYKVQRETADGLFSKVWEYTYPGFIQRGYQRAGLAPDVDAHENIARVKDAVFFMHCGRVVKGVVHRRLPHHKMEITGEHYLRADGSEEPIYLGFKRRLGHEEITADAGVLLALVQETEPKDVDNG